MIPSGDRRSSILSITPLATSSGRPRMVVAKDVVSASLGNVVCVRTGGPASSQRVSFEAALQMSTYR